MKKSFDTWLTKQIEAGTPVTQITDLANDAGFTSPSGVPWTYPNLVKYVQRFKRGSSLPQRAKRGRPAKRKSFAYPSEAQTALKTAVVSEPAQPQIHINMKDELLATYIQAIADIQMPEVLKLQAIRDRAALTRAHR